MRNKKSEWKRHCVEMQNALNGNNYERYGFYVNHKGELVFNWLKNVNYGYFVRRAL